MNDKKKINDNTASTEEEIKRGRKFSLADALGSEAAGALKGASPVAPMTQTLLEIENILETRLYDPEGSLQSTIMARLEHDQPLIARNFGNPAAALKEFLAPTLKSKSALASLVRDADARWGRDYGERPHFNSPDQPAHADDPYTPESVEAILQELLDTLG